MVYDFTDPEIVTMVQMNHRPTELAASPSATTVAAAGKIEPIPLAIVCTMDHEPWPCAAVTALRRSQATARGGKFMTPAERLQMRIAEGKIVA
jgi:hypothetical protein